MPTPVAAGSYIFDQFAQPQRELDRLKLQTLAVHRPELEALDRHGLARAHHVLDAGCGSGVLLGLMADRHPAAGFTGLDVSPDLLAQAAAQVAGRARPVQLRHGPIAGLRPGPYYDFVLSRFVLQHLSDPAAAVLTLSRQLAPGGRLCLTDVDDSWFLLEPPVAALAELVQLTEARQRGLGGSRRIGRRLPELLRQAGCLDIQVDVLTANSEQLGMPAFLELTTGFRPQLFAGHPDEARARALAATVRQQATQGYHFGLVSCFVVSGRRV